MPNHKLECALGFGARTQHWFAPITERGKYICAVVAVLGVWSFNVTKVALLDKWIDDLNTGAIEVYKRQWGRAQLARTTRMMS